MAYAPDVSTLCLAVGKLLVTIPVASFTLAWTHSIEKTRWEEDWQIAGGQLSISAARIKGSGAGMEPPTNARLEAGTWHYRPDMPPMRSVRLTHSTHAAGYEFCTDGRCQPLASLIPGIGDNAIIEMSACPKNSQ